jgi:cell wall-active antibiotic response 4TMS protein YvqF
MDMNELNCAIRGPITLITIGTLFALDHFTRYGFDRTWPILLIVFGLLSLLCRASTTRSVTSSRGGTP